MSARAPPRRCAGFTLIEILVAFTLIALVFGSALEVFSTGLRSSALFEDHAFAALAAESRLAETVADPDLDVGEGRGLVAGWTGDPRGMIWRTTVTPFEIGADGNGNAAGDRSGVAPLLVAVRVTWPDGARTRAVTVSTFALGRER